MQTNSCRGQAASGISWCRIPGVPLLAIVVATVCLCSSPAPAQLKGDKALLELVASEWRANVAAIRTWQGKVEYTSRLSGNLLPKKEEEQEVEIVTELEFALDVPANRLMFVATETSKSRKKSDPSKVNITRSGFGGIRTSKGYYRVPAWNMNDPASQPSLALQSLTSFSLGDFSPDFDPMRFFRLIDHDVYERLMFYHKHADREEVNESIFREGNLVTFKQEDLPSAWFQHQVFDLAQGGNPIEISASQPSLSMVWSRTFEKIGTIWVPKTAYVKSTNTKKKINQERKTIWVKNVVNEPILDEVFSPEKIGIRQGARVQDARVGVQYRYDAALPPEELVIRKTNWVPYLAAGIVIMVAGVCYLVWRMRRRKPKEFGHAPSM